MQQDDQVEYKGVIVEPSEEIRVLLVQLVCQVLKQATKLIGPFASDIASVLMSAATDKDPSVLKVAFPTLEYFGELMDIKLKAVSKHLISVTLHALSHKHSSIRVCALQAIQRLVQCGGHESLYDMTAYHDPNVIPIHAFYHPNVKTQYLAVLASDRSISVRETLLRTVACWLLKLPERREHEIQLLPYVLSAFNDENLQLQELAFELMEHIGQQYEKENQDEVKDVKQYLPEDIQPIDISTKDCFVPSFFKCRPCLGARIMVKRNFGILLRALSADLQAWQHEPKCLAAQLLYVLIMFVEENTTMHLQNLIVTMMKSGSDPLVEKKIEGCARALGFFVDPSSYLEILIPRINGEYNADSSVQDIGKALKVLSWLMQGSRPDLLGSHIPEICTLLTEQDLMTSLQQEVHESILAILDVVVRVFDESCKDEALPIIWLLLNAFAVGELRQKPCRERIDYAMETLSKSIPFQKNGNSVIAYIDNVLNILQPPQFRSLYALDAIIFFRLLEEASMVNDSIFAKLFNMSKEYLLCSGSHNVKYRFVCTMQRMVEKAPLKCPLLEKRFSNLVETCLCPCLKDISKDKASMYIKPILQTICKPWSRLVLDSSSIFDVIKGEFNVDFKKNEGSEKKGQNSCEDLEGMLLQSYIKWMGR